MIPILLVIVAFLVSTTWLVNLGPKSEDLLHHISIDDILHGDWYEGSRLLIGRGFPVTNRPGGVR